VLPLTFGLIVELSNFAYCMSVTLEFLAFVKLQILDEGKLHTLLWNSMSLHRLCLKYIMLPRCISPSDHPILRKTMYFLFLTPALIINVLVMLLASYATYIYAAIVIFIGLLLINAKPIGSFFRKLGRSHKNEGSSSIGSLDKTVT
jgi:hypothetical protein